MERNGNSGAGQQPEGFSSLEEKRRIQDEELRNLFSADEDDDGARSRQGTAVTPRPAPGTNAETRMDDTVSESERDDSSDGEANGTREPNLTRRGAVALGLFAAGALAGGGGVMAATRSRNETLNKEEHGYGNASRAVGETEKYSTLREVFAHIDSERFDENTGDLGRVMNDPETVGGHAWAFEAGEDASNERMRHWVAYKNNLQDNIEFIDRYSKSYNGLQTADDYGAFYEHIAYTTRPVAAADLIALKHPEFAELSLEQAEAKLKEINDYRPEDALAYKKWLEANYAHGKTKYEFVDIPDSTFTNMGIEDRNAEHGMFSVCDDSELLRDEKNQLVAATTTLGDGTKVTRYINPVCINILNVVRVNGKTFTLSVDKPIEEVPDNPSVPEYNPPKDNPPEELKSKDSENMERIDDEAHGDIANDVGTEEVNVSRTDQAEVESQPVTSQPSADSYGGTEPSIVESEPSYAAEPVSPSPSNDYGQNVGGANSGYAPVQPDTSAPLVEDVAPPATASDAADILSDLGIN